ncbi:MAG: hypothetical protein KJ044_01385 [Planctomycetes bacterium]|nr:hypothetical protein [Planctomycetota bacterium]
MSAGPQGTVTLVFTDVQDSSRLWEQHGRMFEPVLALHNRILREQIAAHGGYEVKTEGDAFMVAFADAGAALRFCADTQRALARAPWPQPAGGVQVRMGMHTGEPIVSTDPATGRTDYFGPVVNRAARVAAAGRGGQVLLSETAWRVSGAALSGLACSELGEHRLRGLEQPERLFQVLPPELAQREFPPLNTVTALPTNLPPQASSFIGRQAELAELCELLAPRKSGQSGRHAGTSPGTKLLRGPGGAIAREVARLVALTGPGGTGKTRLAVRAGHELIDRFEGGVWFADCSGAADGAGVAHAVALALGLRLTGAENPVLAVANVLEYRKPLLLILDNFEQVAAFAADTIGAWRKRAPQVSFLVTSRAVLGLAGEQQYELAPLTPPPRRVDTTQLEVLRACESVALFVERAQEADPRFVLDESNLADVCQICLELDGLPLALELAASRVRMLKPAQMVKRLGRKFELLKSSRRDLSPRQQTMYGAIEWGFELLNETERDAFVQACAFHEGFLLEAAEAVVDLSARGDAPDVLDVLQSLREKSLLHAVEGGHETRFRMYRPILEFGRERQTTDMSAESRAALANRHMRHFADHAWHWAGRVEGPDELEALDRLEAERENIVAAVEHACASRQAELAAKGALGLWELLLVRGPVELRGRLLDAALALDQTPHWRARLLTARARAHQEVGESAPNLELAAQAVALAGKDPVVGVEAGVQLANALWQVSRLAESHQTALDAARLAREHGNERGLARALGTAGICQINLGDLPGADATLAEAETLWRKLGYRRGVAHNVANRGVVMGRENRRLEALAAYEDAERIYDEIGYTVGVARMVGNRGAQHQRGGDLQRAEECYNQASVLARQIGAKFALISNISNLGVLKSNRGDYTGALADYNEALELARQTGSRQSEADMIGKLAEMHARKREFGIALELRREGRRILQEVGDAWNVWDSSYSICRILYRAGRAAEIPAEASRSEPLFKDAPLHYRVGLSAWLAVGLAGQGDWDNAAGHMRRALDQFATFSAEQTGRDRVLFGALLGEMAEQAGKTALADEMAKLCARMLELHPALHKTTQDLERPWLVSRGLTQPEPDAAGGSVA